MEGLMSDATKPAPGRLARVIATRGGRAEPEAPLVIEHREALIYMLCEAAELEHAIMCQYLFAVFSLKQGTDEGLTEEELAAVTRWRRSISHVATEEMLHLALVHNLLSAIGAAPHFARPNMPAPAGHYPAGVQLGLLPFGEQAVRHFMFLERPEGMQLKDAEAFAAAVGDSVPLAAEADIVPRLQDFATVGHLYRSIEQGFGRLVEKYGERSLFVGPPKAQATRADFSWPELVAVTDLASAQAAIDTILEQGEGARGDWQDAHFGQFVEILDEYRQMRKANPDFDPVRPVLVANVRPHEHVEGIPLIGDPVTARCADLFNVGYEILLQTFERYFAHTEETDAQLSTLADATVALMLQVLKPLGDLIPTLPVGGDHPGMTAAPSFELFYESDYLMPHREAAWALLEERLREAADFCTRLLGKADLGESLSDRLEPVAQALGEIADSLAAHFPDWGAVSRYAPAALPPDPDRSDAEPLLGQAAQLARAVSASQPADDGARRVQGLFAEANQLLVAATRAAVQRPTNLAPRLLDSVLRPIAQALSSEQPDTSAPGATPDRDGGSDAGPADDPVAIDDRVWSLAQSATQLRASLDGDANVVPALAEATAALQDLAVQSAPAEGADNSEARLSLLRDLQADVAVGIRVATDGPYLLTNAASLYGSLGERLPTRPQMALCRCGESATKPFCDGSHARVGFKGAKDPKRVPDRRDTYVGQQVTIFDNRGICQHSGLCTDRLASVFHTDSEPFVTPSGGRMDEIIHAVRNCPSGALSYAVDGVEVRDEVDFHGNREFAVEVSRDGPYRVTGSIPLLDGEGRPEQRNGGASLEHYALCRCGHSQNKPFCSGMHWYVDFTDPVAGPDHEPTMFEWCGGLPALTRMTRLFYERYVPQDPLLAPLFANMSADHPERVAKWLGEVFGGPPCYSDEYGGYQRMLTQHLGKALTEERRARWVELISQSAEEAGMPADPEFRSAFTAYIEWGSRIALENSQPDAKPPEGMPMPHWGWGAAGPPGSRISALGAPAEERLQDVALPGADEPVSFANHVKPLFRERDRQSMKFAFDLWAYGDVKANAKAVLDRLDDGSMPCDGAWPEEKVATFRRWVESGMPA
jgi:CDGSH-type Zn-finger protein